MKKTYRIVERVNGHGMSEYTVQRKSIFGFWYNPDNVDGNTTGTYHSLEDAKLAVKAKLTPVS